jgi:hypothetical protein
MVVSHHALATSVLAVHYDQLTTHVATAQAVPLDYNRMQTAAVTLARKLIAHKHIRIHTKSSRKPKAISKRALFRCG